MTNLSMQAVVPSPESYRFIPLTQGQLAIVDVADFDWLNQWPWCVRIDRYKTSISYYAERRVKGKNLSMHSLILATPSGMVGDHWNGDTLDNRRCNLRNISRSANLLNRCCQRNNTSGAKGVLYLKDRGRWRAKITHAGITYCNSSFATESKAIEWRIEKELEIFGEYSRLLAPLCVARPLFHSLTHS